MHAYKSFMRRFAPDNLRCLFCSKIVTSTAVGLDKKTPMRLNQDLSGEINLIHRKVTAGCYTFTPYRLILSSKGRGKAPREFNVATVRDRLTLAALSELLDDVYGITCSTPHPQVLVGDALEAVNCGRFTHCLKADLAGFYPSIPHDKLLSLLNRKIRKPEIRKLIKSAIMTPNAPMGTKAVGVRTAGVPEGLAISNRLANIYAAQLDAAFAKKADIRYIRYVDDILVFYNEHNKRISPDIRASLGREVEKLGLKLNKDKTHSYELRCDAFQFLGYEFKPGGQLSVRVSTVRRLEQALERDLGKMRGKTGQQLKSAVRHLNTRVTGCRITEDGIRFQRYGWLHYYSRISDVSLLCKLDLLIAKLVNRYGLDILGDLKSFKKTYYQMRYKANTSRYIPTYDMGCTAEEKKRDLQFLFPQEDWGAKTDEEIERLYSRRIRSLASRLEKDVGTVS